MGTHLTGDDIRNRRFVARTRHGMDPDEVLPLLGAAANEIDRLSHALAAAVEEGSRAERPVPIDPDQADDSAYLLLRTARQAAEEALVSARASAAQIREDVLKRGRRTLDGAKQKAQNIVTAAERRADEIVSDAQIRAEALIADAQQVHAQANHDAAEVRRTAEWIATTRESELNAREEELSARELAFDHLVAERCDRLRAAGATLDVLADALAAQGDDAANVIDPSRLIDVRRRRRLRLTAHG